MKFKLPNIDLFGFSGEDSSREEEKEYPPFKEQIRKFIDELKTKLKKKKKSTIVLFVIIVLLCLYLTGALATFVRSFGTAAEDGLRNAVKPSFNPITAFLVLFDIKYSIWGFLVVLILAAGVLFWYIRNHITLGSVEVQERSGATYQKQVQDATLGSARELNEDEIAENFLVVSKEEFINNNPKTMLFGMLPETEDYIMAKPVDKYRVPNVSSIVFGDSGSFKTTSYLIPTLMQICKAGQNAFCTDNSGEVFALTYKMFKDEGYNIRVFNTINPKVSDTWNFIGSGGDDIDIAKMYAKTIVESTETPNTKTDSYFKDGMLSILPALMVYVNQTGADKGKNNIEEVLRVIIDYDIDELRTIFHSLDHDNVAYKQFRIFERSPVQENFLSNAAERLDMFVSGEISRICSDDGIDIIKELGSEDTKTIIYVITENQYAFISALFLNASVKLLTNHARDNCAKRVLPRKVYYVFEEFLTMGYVPNMGTNLSEKRKYGFIFLLICQALPQFYNIYGELEAQTIMASCKYKLLFGAGDTMTAEEFEKYCGPTTVRTSMKAAGDPLIKTTDQVREGQQQRMLYYYNELMTMNETEYMLFTTHLHPLKLIKPFYRTLPGGSQLDDNEIHYKNYTPQEPINHPLQEKSKNTKKKLEVIKSDTAANARSHNIKDKNSRKQAIEQKSRKRNTVDETQMAESLFAKAERLTKNRPCVNEEDIYVSVKDGRAYLNVCKIVSELRAIKGVQ